ncbi:MAG: hypothetical protein ABI142_13115, partial [Bryocella sp.]
MPSSPPPSSDLEFDPAESPSEALSEARATRHQRDKPPSLLSYPATYFLIGINVLVFAIMFPHSPAIGMIRHHSGMDI